MTALESTHDIFVNQQGLRLEDITHSYDGNEVLHGVSFDVGLGGNVVLMNGPSGSGKTTLLNIASGIEVPDSGRVMSDYFDISAFSPEDRRAWRAGNGNMFQQSGLLNGMTVMENVEFPHLFNRAYRPDRAWTNSVLGETGVSSLLDKRTKTLSGGQKQRVALARALIHRPRLVFTDEPTASLDGPSKVEILGVIQRTAKNLGATVLMVSHDRQAEDYADRVVTLVDGRIASDSAQRDREAQVAPIMDLTA